MTRRRSASGALAVVLALSGLSACGGTGTGALVAQVGRARITSATVAHWAALEERAQGGGAAREDQEQQVSRERALEFLIGADWTLGQARELGVSASDGEARTRLALFKYDQLEGIEHPRLAREAELERCIARGAPAADQMWVMKLSLLQSRIDVALRTRAYRQITPAQVARYYRAHTASLFVPMRRYFEILLTSKRATAVRARREIEAGQSFLAVARRVSNDPEAPHGLQALSPGEEERPFRAHIFAAGLRRLVGPIHQAADFYLFRVLRIRPRRTMGIAEAEGEIRQGLSAPGARALSEATTQAWRGQTTCRAAYTVPSCREWVGRRQSPEFVDSRRRPLAHSPGKFASVESGRARALDEPAVPQRVASVVQRHEGEATMRRLKIIGVAALAVFAVTAMASATAFALPTLKPNTAVTFTGTSPVGKLEVLGSALVVECEKNADEGSFAAETVLGPFHIKFSGCSAKLGTTGLGKCTGLGDTETGVILSLGEVHLVYDSLAPLGAAMLFLVEPTHFECKSITTVLITVEGSVLCLVTPINTPTKAPKVKCEGEKGDAKETTYWNDAGEAKTTLLKSSENEKEAKAASENTEATLTPSHELEVIA
ncbi:MAG TPA: peptidylprolyl isomerase [Solirubrobacteraceae bacterium]|jgi:parvulin-like peptidyl-prolyl isomerase